jgi:hypothetical protein
MRRQRRERAEVPRAAEMRVFLPDTGDGPRGGMGMMEFGVWMAMSKPLLDLGNLSPRKLMRRCPPL